MIATYFEKSSYWVLLGLVLPLAAIIAFPISMVLDKRREATA